MSDVQPETAARRSLVLKHPDVAKRLCELPLRYATPEQWNGYVPPPVWGGQQNDAPEREALLAIVTAAEHAEAEAIAASQEAS